MKYVLLDYVGEEGWMARLTRDEAKRYWLVAYKATYMEAMTKAGVLKNTIGLQPYGDTATTMRVRDDEPER